MRAHPEPEPTADTGKPLTRFRRNSPFIQACILVIVLFCCQGMNATVVGLGAGASRPSNIPVVDKVQIVGTCTIVLSGLFAGSINNKIGPRYTLALGASGYPIYIGALWWLDRGSGVWFAYLASVYHGAGAALSFSAAGYVVSSYSVEQNRGRYTATMWSAIGVGSSVGAAIVLGITWAAHTKHSHVPTTVYATIVAIQCVGVLVALLLADPSQVRRNDRRPIAYFMSLTWREELLALGSSLTTPTVFLLALGFLSSQMPLSILGSLNAFYFNARSRSLVNLCFWISASSGSLFMAIFCDANIFGHRRRRALIGGAVAAAFMLGAWASLLWFLGSRHINRSGKPWDVDVRSGHDFADPLAILIILGFSFATFQTYSQWIYGTVTNRPTTLSRFSGFFESMRAVGLAVAFGIDSHNTPFLTEAGTYFTLTSAGLALSVVAALKYTTYSRYGKEEDVVVPEAFEEHIRGLPYGVGAAMELPDLDIIPSKEDDAKMVH